MSSFKGIILLAIFLALQTGHLVAQGKDRVEILSAGNFEYVKINGRDISKLIGNVKLKQSRTFMYCDSALIFEDENKVEAFSNVKIEHNDSVTITGDYLLYEGNSKKALIKGNVKLVDNNMTLTTSQLDYDLDNQFGYYATGGTILNKENKLSSKVGYYYARRNEFFFKSKVLLTHPEYTMTSDTLLYNTLTKTAFFYGPTQIKGDNDKIICENGWYNTQTDQSQFSRNAVVYTEKKMLAADSLYYDRRNQLGKAFRRVHIYDSVQSVHLYGNKGITNGKAKITYVEGDCFGIKMMDGKDSMFLYADTLWISEKQGKQKEVLKAYRKVKIFKADLQAVCDSMVYRSDDSLLSMYHSPILWSGQNQIFADTVVFYIRNQKLDSFNLLNDAMVISKEKGNHYNQIKGKNMQGRMDSSSIKEIWVFGNGQSIYYAKEDSIHYTGINVVDCGIMSFQFKNGAIEKAAFITKPEAVLYPPNTKRPEDLRLRGFKWYGNKRPQKMYRQ